MSVWDLYRSFKKFEQAQEKRSRCYEVLNPDQCRDQEEALSRAYQDTETVFDNLVDERIGEFLFEREEEAASG